MPPTLLEAETVAEIFNVSSETVKRWARAGRIPSIRTPGGHLRFRREDVEQAIGHAISDDEAAAS